MHFGSGSRQESPGETALRLTLAAKKAKGQWMRDEEVVQLVEGVMRRTFRRFQEKLPPGDDYVRRSVDRLMEDLHEIALQSYREVVEARQPERKPRLPAAFKRL